MPIESPAYITRSFEGECFNLLTAGNWVLLLGPRQHGKSSALARIRRSLMDAGYAVASIDFQAFAAPDSSYPSLLGWFARHVARDWGSVSSEPPEREAHELEHWLERVAPPGSGALALFVDEAGALPDAWRIPFYSQFRALFNHKVDAEASSVARRLVVLFSGTFRPERLVREDTNSPFNISADVHPEDLTKEQALELARQVTGTDLEPWTSRTYELVRGQPYLTQLILSTVAAGTTESERDDSFTDAIRRLRTGDDRHFSSMFEQIVSDSELTAIVGRIAQSADGIPLVPADGNHAFLRILGVAREHEGRLQMRNVPYREFALADPALCPGTVTDVEQSLLRRDLGFFQFVRDHALQELALDGYEGAVDAYNNGHHRLALAGFGSCLEAILIDFLQGLNPTELESARTSVQPPPTPATKPAEWNLVELIDVAHQTAAFGGTKTALSHALRDWRNSIHPAVAMQNYRAQSELFQEVRIANAVVEIVARNLQVQSPSP